jgi:hypothetical protein
MNRWGICILWTFVAVASSHAEITLTDLQNRKATVEIIEATPSELTVEIKGRRMPLKLDQLAEASRTAAIDYAKAKGVFGSFPAVKVQVKIAYQRRNTEGSYYRKDMKLLPSFTIEGVRKMDKIPAAEATLVIITHDTEAKYVNHMDKMQVYATETIPLPAGEGERREFSYKPVSTTFDSARDPSNVGGDEYRYYIFGLRDPATKKLIDFQTNSAKLEAHVAKHPETREAFLASGINSAFTEEFAKK